MSRAKRPKRLPTVLARSEVQYLIGGMCGKYRLMTRLLHGSGLRLMECIRLRVKDIDFGQHQIIIHDGKGLKDRITLLPDTVEQELHRHFRHISCSMKMILPTVLAEFHYPTHWPSNIPVRNLSGNGSTFSHPRTSKKIRAPAN